MSSPLDDGASPTTAIDVTATQIESLDADKSVASLDFEGTREKAEGVERSLSGGEHKSSAKDIDPAAADTDSFRPVSGKDVEGKPPQSAPTRTSSARDPSKQDTEDSLPPLPSLPPAPIAGTFTTFEDTDAETDIPFDDALDAPPFAQLQASVERIVNRAAPQTSNALDGGAAGVEAGTTVTIGGVEMRMRSEEEIERAENEALMDPDDPLLARVQASLRTSLTAHLTRLNDLLINKQYSLQTARSRREDVGSRLYTLQSELVKLQERATKQQDDLERSKRAREDGERRREEERRVWKEVGGRVEQQERNVAAHRTEHAALLSSLHTLHLHVTQLSSQTSVAKTTALKTERDLQTLESQKLAQDLYVDRLTLQLKNLEDQRAVLTRQLELQRNETRRARETVQEAEVEAEALGFEKNRLAGEWKRAVQGVERRDGVAKEVGDAIGKMRSHLQTLTTEHTSTLRHLSMSTSRHQTLTALLRRLQSERDLLNRHLQLSSERLDRLRESHAIHAKSLVQTEQELAGVDRERAQVAAEVAQLGKQIQVHASAAAAAEQAVAEQAQRLGSAEKSAKGQARNLSKMQKAVHEAEAELAQSMNEIGQTGVNAAMLAEENKEKRRRIAEVDAELKELNATVDKYEQEVKRRNDEIQKKQAEFDTMNKKLEHALAGKKDANLGPLEATIANLTKNIQAKKIELEQLQAAWLRAQNDLVAVVKRKEEAQEEMKDLRVKCAVMERKKVELNGAFESQERVLATHARSIRQLQQTLVRINTLISQQAVQQSRLEEANLGLENEYRGRLRDAEDEALRLEEAYERLVTEKEKAEESFLDFERQILLWEKKIQIAKETADALDPNVGSADLVAMRAEIHRMKLRLSSLLKLQEKMIQEMEKCVLRRETIGTKAGGGIAMMIGLEGEKGKRGLAGQQQLRKAIEDLTRKLRTLVQDVKEAERELQSVSSTTSRLASIISEANDSITHVTDRTIQVQSEIISKANVKVTMATEVLLFQKGGKRYQELKDGKYVPTIKEEAKRAEEWEAWKEKLRTIEAVLVKAEDDFSDKSNLREVFTGAHHLLQSGGKAVSTAPPASSAFAPMRSSSSLSKESSGVGNGIEV